MLADFPTVEQALESFKANPQLYLSGGPMTGALLLNKFLIRNKGAQMLMMTGATGATIKMVIGPYMDQITQHWHELIQILGLAT